jgi:hypothetical protein
MRRQRADSNHARRQKPSNQNVTRPLNTIQGDDIEEDNVMDEEKIPNRVLPIFQNLFELKIDSANSKVHVFCK